MPADHYLDFAATSALRPPEVADAVADFLRDCGATPGRGSHHRALDAGRMVFRTRRALARLLGLHEEPGQVVFGAHATQAINTVLGSLDPGQVLVVTDLDHNAVLRPAHHLAGAGIEVRRVAADPRGELDPDSLERALDGADLLTVNAASNVLGSRLPVGEIAQRARSAGARVLVDTAQTAGHLVDDLAGADYVAITGHKGLLAPQGIGALWIREGAPIRPLLRGGTGGNSLDREMPAALPDRLEAGTLNAPGIAGLAAGIDWLEREGVEAIHRRLSVLRLRLHDGLAGVAGVRVLSPRDPAGAPIVTAVSDRLDPGALAHGLDRRFGVQTRSGHHCAPEVHRLLRTTRAGAVRFSLGWCSTEADVDRAVEGVEALTAFPERSVPR
ncbi:aminotransferase class V-fold PLP-dependent enzyme [Gaopeijia maritima]|uniref:aminotransferase class V-fold PLP-dependent enzyme n=1 Tax=Gaopeijia maritima TaxID=3119007 RepID=UPI003247F018